MKSMLRRALFLPSPSLAREMRRYWWVMALVVAATLLVLNGLYSPVSLARSFDTVLVGAYGAMAGLSGHTAVRMLAGRRLKKS